MERLPEPVVANLQPATTTWKADQILFRVHGGTPANTFNPGYGCGRFHPIRDRRGEPIPTLYASDMIDGALSEMLFRGGVTASSGSIHRTDLESLFLSRLVSETDLQLVDLTGLALRRLGVTRDQLIEAPERCYRDTARWAEALHEAGANAHGLTWVSRQCDTSKSVVLFGDRIDASVLRPAEPAEPLHRGRGFRRVCEAAGRANVAVIQ